MPNIGLSVSQCATIENERMHFEKPVPYNCLSLDV